MIKLGVTACLMYPDEDRTYFPPKYLCYLERDMARYLYRPNVLPVLIPDLDREVLYDLLAQMDGFVLQGGSTWPRKPTAKPRSVAGWAIPCEMPTNLIFWTTP